MKKKIHTYTVSGHEFLSDVVTEMPNEKIFEEMIGGTQKVFQIGNTCFIRDNIAAIVVEDVAEEPKPCEDACSNPISNPLKLEA